MQRNSAHRFLSKPPSRRQESDYLKLGMTSLPRNVRALVKFIESKSEIKDEVVEAELHIFLNIV
jgi:hypothetical protein